jgi:hypothetical protein
LLMLMKSQVLSVSFRTQGRVDVEPSSIVNSLRECAMTSPRAYQAAADDLEDEVVEIYIFFGLSGKCICLSRNCFLLLGLDVYDLLFTLKLASDIFSCFSMDVRSDLVLI